MVRIAAIHTQALLAASALAVLLIAGNVAVAQTTVAAAIRYYDEVQPADLAPGSAVLPEQQVVWLRPPRAAEGGETGFTHGRSASLLDWAGWRSSRILLLGPDGQPGGIRLHSVAGTGKAAVGFGLDSISQPGLPAAYLIHGQLQAGGLSGPGALLHARADGFGGGYEDTGSAGWRIGFESGYGLAVREGWLIRPGLLRPYLAGHVAGQGSGYGFGIDWRERSKPYRIRFSLTEDELRGGPHSRFSLELLE